MIGLPDETLKDALKTLDLNIKCKPTLGWSSLYQPYPGTSFGDECIRSGLLSGDIDMFDPSFFTGSVLPLEQKTKFVNLQRLFGIIVQYPILRRLLFLLLAFSENKFYLKLYNFHKKWIYDHRLFK
jgi:radical SAM superfamily enzyme YgiQ (UPF0313 family)